MSKLVKLEDVFRVLSEYESSMKDDLLVDDLTNSLMSLPSESKEAENMSPKDFEGLKAVSLYKVIEECGEEITKEDPELTALFMRFYLLGFKAGSPAVLFDKIDFK